MARKPKLTKYPEIKWSIEGQARSGKSTLAFAIARELANLVYLWNTDGRVQEYVHRVGEGKILVPDVNNVFDTIAVQNAVREDLNNGEFRGVDLFVMDNATHLYQATTRKLQVEKLQGSKESFAMKAHTMRNMLSAIMLPAIPFVVLFHQYMAGDQYGKNKQLRASLSETEVHRLDLALNAKLLTIEYKGRYAVKVLEFRDYPAMQPFTLVDEVGMFEGMPVRIQSALYDHKGQPPDAVSTTKTVQPVAKQPQGWEDFNEKVPFPDKDRAIRLGVEHYEEFEGRKVYPFGDPYEVPTKKDGTEGVNGAINRATNSYQKIRKYVFERTIENAEWKKANPGKEEQRFVVAGMITKLWKVKIEEHISEEIKKIKGSPAEEVTLIKDAFPVPGWDDFNEENPFPDKETAIHLALNHYRLAEHSTVDKERKVYPFGDPTNADATEKANEAYSETREDIYDSTMRVSKWLKDHPEKDERVKIVATQITRLWKDRVEDLIDLALSKVYGEEEKPQEEVPF